MMGEDYRSVAAENYQLILKRDEQIAALTSTMTQKADADLREKTRLNRMIECLNLELCECHGELTQKLARIGQLESEIKPLVADNKSQLAIIHNLRKALTKEDSRAVNTSSQTTVILTTEKACWAVAEVKAA